MTTIDNEGLPLCSETTAAQGTARLLAPRRSVTPTAPPAGTGELPGGPGALVWADLFAVAGAVVLVRWVDPRVGLRSVALLVPLVLLLFAGGGLYRTRLLPSALDDVPVIARRGSVALGFAVLLERLPQIPWAPGLPTELPPLAAVLFALLLLDVLARSCVHAAVRATRRRRPRPVLIAGAGNIGQRVAAALLERREYGLWPVGYLDRDPILLPADSPVPVLGGPAQLERELLRRGIRDVILTPSGSGDADSTHVLRTAVRYECEVWLVPGLPEFGTLEYGNRRPDHGDHLWGLPCLRLGPGPMQRPSWAVKRGVDILVSAAALLLLSPVLAACAVAVRLEGGPGVIFRQERVGLDGQVFTVLKFRSLRPVSEHESATKWNISNDHRLGPVGRFLRKSSLDELPQLWNILRGEMSLVGPRPERPYFAMQFAQDYPRYRDRHRVPVGLTGLAQVNGLRGDTSIEDRARFDNHYIESWSLWQDVKILLQTVVTVLRTSGS